MGKNAGEILFLPPRHTHDLLLIIISFSYFLCLLLRQLHVAKRNGLVFNSETQQMETAPLYKPEV